MLFFRHLTPEALRLLLERRVLPLHLDGEGLMHEQAYRAWKALPEEAQRRAEADLFLIHDLSTVHGRPYLEELAASVWPDGPTRSPSRDWSAEDLAARLFVAAPQPFATVHQGYALDVVQDLLEYRGTYPVMLQTSPARKAELRGAMAQYLHSTAFGSRCYVEDFVDARRLALFVFHEDEVRPFDRFMSDDQIECCWYRSVNRLAAVFHFETSTLFVQALHRPHAEKLRDLFAQLFVGDERYFEEASRRLHFCFDALREPTFRFPTRGEDEIESVSIARVVARPWRREVRRVTVDFEPRATIERIRAELAAHGVDLATDVIDGVRLVVYFQGTGRARMRTVSLINPNHSNLTSTPRDLVIRGYLKDWGIDVVATKCSVVSALYDAAAR